MLFSTEFKAQLKAQEKEAVDRRDLLKRIKSRRLRLLGEMDALRLQMGWREKYFRGWFGGDKRLVQERRQLRTELNDALLKQQAQCAAIEEAERACIEAVAGHLAENDPDYRALNQRCLEVGKVKAAAEELLEAIDRALRDVDDAQSMETLDLVSKNKGIAILSHVENGEANEAISEVERAAKRFQAVMDDYNGGIQEKLAQETGIGRINDDIDLVLDLVGDGFDFMSFFTLSQLDDAEDALTELKERSAGVIEEISARHSSLREQCDRRIADARRRCA